MPGYQDIDPRNLLRCPDGQSRVDGVCVGAAPTCPPNFACIPHMDVIATNSLVDFRRLVAAATVQTFGRGTTAANVERCLVAATDQTSTVDMTVTCLDHAVPEQAVFVRNLAAAFARARRGPAVWADREGYGWGFDCPPGQSVVRTLGGADCYDFAPGVPALRQRLTTGSQMAIRAIGCRSGQSWVAENMRCEVPPEELHCPPGQRPFAGTCIAVETCPSGQEDVDGHGTCRPICTRGYERVGLVCLPVCGTDQVRVRDVCQLTEAEAARVAALAEAARLAALAEAARLAALAEAERSTATKWWLLGGLALVGVGAVAYAATRRK